MAQQIIPVGKKILIHQKEAEKFFKNTNIIIPDKAQERENVGTVIGVGASVSEIKVGDKDIEHLLIQEGDIFAILVDV